MDINNIKHFLLKQRIPYKDINKYVVAFTHTSYVHETIDQNIQSYERLEFLGDSVLGKEIAEYLFLNYKNLPPGELSLLRSNIVNKNSLAIIGKQFNFEKLIFFGKGELGKIPSDSVYEDVFESFIGALYLDLGVEFTQNFIFSIFKNFIKSINLNDLKDYKTQLQEKLQAEKKQPVDYKLVNKTKEDTKIIFHIQAILDKNIILGSGKSDSKRKAEQLAAKDALSKMQTNLEITKEV